MKTTGKVILGIVGAIVAVVLIMAITGTLQYVTAPFRGAVGQQERVQADPDFRIAAYNSFYDLCGQIQATEDSLALAKAEKALPADQHATNVLALKTKRVRLIREYNADASKEDTQANFLASDLPYQIDPNQESTTCSAP